MYYDVYIDIVFLTNLLMDYVLLRIVGKLFLRKRNRGRILLAAARWRSVFLPHFICTAGYDFSCKGTAPWRMCLGHAGSWTGS